MTSFGNAQRLNHRRLRSRGAVRQTINGGRPRKSTGAWKKSGLKVIKWRGMMQSEETSKNTAPYHKYTVETV